MDYHIAMEEDETEISEEDESDNNMVLIGSFNKYVNITEDIPVTVEVASTSESILIIKSMIAKLYEEIDFLKEEIREKNILIKTLNFRNANDGELINIELINSTFESNVETTLDSSLNLTNEICVIKPDNSQNDDYVREYDKIVDYDDSTEDSFNVNVFNSTIIHETIETQINNYKMKHRKNFKNVNIVKQTTADGDVVQLIDSANDNLLDTIDSFNTSMNFHTIDSYITCSANDNSTISDTIDSTNTSMNTYTTDSNITYNKNFTWEKHSNGFARNVMKKMGYYKGKGLGKTEDGITEAITIKDAFPTNILKSEKQKKLVYIASDSMLNQLDEKLLSKKYDVKVKSHGGCTIAGMYRHVPKIIALKPAYILLHVATNDCTNKTSCEVLKELRDLVDHIQDLLPDSEIIISLPIVRRDNVVANQIIKNLCLKIKKLDYKFLDNSNLNFSHLGQKGLHLSNYGTKKMALNIISLIKRL